MSRPRSQYVPALVLALAAGPPAVAADVPFRGTWEGSTVSAEVVGDGVVLVVARGTGEAAHLGRFEMTSPHLTYLATFAIEGTQTFTAADGSTLTATVRGQLAPNPDGSLEGTLEGVITGGTGRLEGATGGYEFHIVARPAGFGFDSTSEFQGTVSVP